MIELLGHKQCLSRSRSASGESSIGLFFMPSPLSKCLARFNLTGPVCGVGQGTAKRYEQIAAYVRTRTAEEVAEMAKGGLQAWAPKSETFTVVKKRQGNTTIKDSATSRMESFTDVEVNLRGDAVSALAPGSAPPAAAKSSAKAAAPTGTAPTKAPAGNPAAAAEAASEKKGVALGAQGTKASSGRGAGSIQGSRTSSVSEVEAAASAAPCANGTSHAEEAPPAVWTDAEDIALVSLSSSFLKSSCDDGIRKLSILFFARSILEMES